MNRPSDLGQFAFVEFHRTGAGIVDCLLRIAGAAKNVQAITAATTKRRNLMRTLYND